MHSSSFKKYIFGVPAHTKTRGGTGQELSRSSILARMLSSKTDPQEGSGPWLGVHRPRTLSLPTAPVELKDWAWREKNLGFPRTS